MSQRAYLIVESKVADPAAYETYKTLAAAAIAQYGGRYLCIPGIPGGTRGAPRDRRNEHAGRRRNREPVLTITFNLLISRKNNEFNR